MELYEAIRRDFRARGAVDPGDRVYASRGQEAFIEGHVEAFRVLGGTPVVQIRYDDLQSAVTRLLFGRSRTGSDRWVAFRSHYGFDTSYCLPGVEGAHEKGGGG